MAETFLILLAGGILLAAAVSDPNQVTLQWLRLCGILALVMAGLAGFFLSRREGGADAPAVVATVATAAFILGQLAFAQVDHRRTQRALAMASFAAAVVAGARILRAGGAVSGASLASALGVATVSGLALMDMLLGHAYLTAAKMTIAPFRRLNLLLAAALVGRAGIAVGGALLLHRLEPVYLLWGAYGLLILTRWLVGLAVPAVFVYMAHDCIKRRSTQSATGILYVAGVLIFIGEVIAVYLARATGLPF
ncbi:MAG TPA: hypothetical protein VER17_15060 [Tepidisphaeraceae bacterium]|nr:hypothetical protein [Tepidisphaeraceae bacterium]